MRISLLHRAVIRSMLLGQWRTVAAAVLTVGLGVALSFGIRIGTSSAQRGLEEDLAAIYSGEWVGPLEFTADLDLEQLSALTFQHDGFLAKEHKVLLVGENSNMDVSLLSFWQYWQALEKRSLGIDSSSATSTSQGLSAVWDGFLRMELHSQEDALSFNQKSLVLVADEICRSKFGSLESVVLSTGEKRDIKWMFQSLGLQGCEQVFARAPHSHDLWKPDALYLRVSGAEQVPALVAAIRSLSAQIEGLSFRDARDQLADLEKLTESMRINLQLMGFVSLFIGIFMVNHVLAILIMRQSLSLSILRAMGIPLVLVIQPLLVFVLMIALLSSVVGAIGGLLIGRGINFLSSRSFAELYDSRIDPSLFKVAPEEIFWVFTLSFLTCGVGAAWPIYRLRNMAVIQTLHAGSWHEARNPVNFLPGWLRFLATVVLAGFLLIFPFHFGRQPVSAYLACFVILLGAVLCVRPSLSAILGFLSKYSVRYPSLLRLRLSFPVSTSVMIQVLMLCFSLTIGVRIMSNSFRSSLEMWVDDTLKADLWVRSRIGSDQPLPQGVREDLFDLEVSGLARAVDGLRVVPAHLVIEGSQRLGFPMVISAVSLRAQGRVEPLRLLEIRVGQDSIIQGAEGLTQIDLTGSSEKIRQSDLSIWAMEKGRRCRGDNDDPCPAYMSQSLQLRLEQSQANQSQLIVNVHGRLIHFTPIAVFHDFGNDSGSLLLDAPMLSRLIRKELEPGFMNVYLQPHALGQTEILLKEFEDKWMRDSGDGTGFAVEVFSGQTLRARIMRSFEETFAITDALYILSAAVAFVTVLCTLSLQLLMRSQEWTLLWATTWPLPRMRKQLSLWSGHLTLLAFGLSLPVGLALGGVLVFVVNRYAFGFVLDLDLPFFFVALLGILSWITGYLGAMWTTRQLSRHCQPAKLHPE